MPRPLPRPKNAPYPIPKWVWAWLKWRRNPQKAPVPAPVPQPITMYDSVTLSEIPAKAQAVAGYVNGNWPTFHQLEINFPHAQHLSIAVNASADAQCLDVERGDASPNEAPGWVKRQLNRGVKRPVIYTSVSQAQTVLRLLSLSGIKRSQIRLWTAHYTGKPHRCTKECDNGFYDHADATQWTNHALDRNLDASLCAPDFF